ncbi:MAG: hypothetical protein H9535_08515 [Ignavibacteria bacterium]|nr:hypothetical protein [Ignavibacteria bacterium]
MKQHLPRAYNNFRSKESVSSEPVSDIRQLPVCNVTIFFIFQIFSLVALLLEPNIFAGAALLNLLCSSLRASSRARLAS